MSNDEQQSVTHGSSSAKKAHGYNDITASAEASEHVASESRYADAGVFIKYDRSIENLSDDIIRSDLIRRTRSESTGSTTSLSSQSKQNPAAYNLPENSNDNMDGPQFDHSKSDHPDGRNDVTSDGLKPERTGNDPSNKPFCQSIIKLSSSDKQSISISSLLQ